MRLEPCAQRQSNIFRRFRSIGVAAAIVFASSPLSAQEGAGLVAGEAFVTKFSGTAVVDEGGGARTVIDLAGTVGVAVDLRAPGFAADGRHWLNEPRLFAVTAGDVGQVFGVALDDATPPNIYLTATAAFGLHRNADNSGWLDGMWGPGGGPGSIWRLDAADGYRAKLFADIALDGRANSGAALGNIAFDRRHRQFFVSDLETGMIHRLSLDGQDLGHFDHGTDGRGNFTDAATGVAMSLAPIAFDPATSAHVTDCPAGEYARSPSCWNFADFRRRVFGLAVRGDSGPGAGGARLYYSVWGSQAYGNPDFAGAGDDQQNSVWSVAIREDGSFDAASVRREFLLPEFFRSPEALARAGMSNPVADIAFPAFGEQATMLVAERGGFRNLGLAAEEPFAWPREARVLRYELDAAGVWQSAGRYDVGFFDRQTDGPPYVRANAAGGVAFGTGYDAAGALDPARLDGFVWMTGDALCSTNGACLDPATGAHGDTSAVSGLQGTDAAGLVDVTPDAAFEPYPASGAATPPTGPDQSYMIDIDVNVDATGAPLPDELTRNDATRIGDVVVLQQAPAVIAEEEPVAPTPEGLDLSIAKHAIGACAAGGPCSFEVTIANVGGVAYAGPLAVIELPEHNGFLGTGTPGWSCDDALPGLAECGIDAVSLAPGDSISFQVSVAIPGWWSQAVFENCVELSLPAADMHSHNNRACGYAPTAEPGTAYYLPDLRLTKFGVDGQCDPADNCLFVVRITNVGAASYTGPLAFHDEVDFPGATLAAWAPAPAWSCGPVASDAFNCFHGPVTLAPGEFRDVTLWIDAPPASPGHTTVRNCASIDWGGASGDYNPGNEYDCATISRLPTGHPDAVAMLDVVKEMSSRCYPNLAGDWECNFDIRITNFGSAPFIGPIEVTDTQAGPAPSTFGSYYSPPWTCVPGIGSGAAQTCTRPGVPGGLQPGETTHLFGTLIVPGTVVPPTYLLNCATIASDHDGDGVAEEHSYCDASLVCTPGAGGDCPQDAVIAKYEPFEECYPGFDCEFSIAIGNLGDHPYTAPITVTEIPDSGVGPLVVVGPPAFTCALAGLNYTCTWPHDIAPGDMFSAVVRFAIPPGHPGPSFTNCARLLPGPENLISFNDEDCATAFVPFPDLAPWSPSTCERGTACTLDVQIDNKGLLPFKGRAGVKGNLSPAVTITSITSQTAGLACSVTGNGAYECESANPLDIPAGGAAHFRLIVDIPGDFGPDAITHTKDMVWPDRAVKDKRPENDRHVSTITITGTKEEAEEEETPPPPPGDGPDLAVTKAADQRSCVAGKACGFTVTVRNVGKGAYNGPIVIEDVVTPAGAKLASAGPSPWSCRGSTGTLTCSHPSTGLAAGAAKTLKLAFATSSRATGGLGDCAALKWSEAARVFAVQIALGETGFAKWSQSTPPDGKFGPRTREAVEAYQKAAGLKVTGRIDDALLTRLFGSWGEGDVNAGNDRACASATLQPPPVQVTCTGGTVSNGQCVCPAGTERRQTATNAFQCVKPLPQISCAGGKVQNGQCVCPKGFERQRISATAFQCVRPEVQITCAGGKVESGQCVCPKGLERQRLSATAFQCVRPEVQITCTGGNVQNGRCVCPEGFERQRISTNVFQCVRETPQITCTGGSIENGRCVCPKGFERQRISANVFQCVRETPEIVCRGGRVQNGQCICPAGTELRQTATNAFRCDEVGPQIVCEGGKVRKGRCICPKGETAQVTGRNAFRCVAPLSPTLIPAKPLSVPTIE